LLDDELLLMELIASMTIEVGKGGLTPLLLPDDELLPIELIASMTIEVGKGA